MTGSRNADRFRKIPAKETATRVRLSVSDKHAVVRRLKALGAGRRPSSSHVVAVAVYYGVSTKSVYRWLNQPELSADVAPRPTTRPRFEVTVDHLTVLADEQNSRDAFRRLDAAGLIACSYPTFTRALKRADPGLVAAALNGYKGLIEHRLYLQIDVPHRGHTYHVDHTELDLYVWPSHKHAVPMRPHVTVIVDAFSGLVWAFPWYQPVNGDMVAAALAEAGTGRTYFGVEIGGEPEQVILDNAAEHFGPSMRAGAAALGWIFTPTAPYSSWQNGKAERAIRLVNERLSRKAPGATNAGKTRTGSSRHGDSSPGRIRPDSVWSARAFELALREAVDHINTEIPVERNGGLTRLKKYASDSTERRPLDAEVARLAMMTSGANTHKATKNGLRFQGRDYTSHLLTYGESYLVRFLPTVRDSIEIFTVDNEFVCTAWPTGDLPENERKRFMAARARQERDAKAIESGVIAERRHRAALDNSIAEDEESGWTEETDPRRPVDDLPGRDPDQAKTKVKPRYKLPRVPVVKTQPIKDRKANIAFLESRQPNVALTDSDSDNQEVPK